MSTGTCQETWREGKSYFEYIAFGVLGGRLVEVV